jgi:hypothetical protein
VKSSCIGLLVFLLWSALPASSMAQADSVVAGPIPPGTRVRVSAPMVFRGVVAGRVSHTVTDTLFLAPRKGGLLAVPLSAITRTEVSQGVRHWEGALRGAGIGALAGGGLFGFMVFAGETNCDYCLPGRDLQAAAVGAVIGAVLFTPVGALIGAIRGYERWGAAETRSGIGYVPHESGPGIRVTARVP